MAQDWPRCVIAINPKQKEVAGKLTSELAPAWRGGRARAAWRRLGLTHGPLGCGPRPRARVTGAGHP